MDSPKRGAGSALVLVLVIVAVEYVARHIVAPALPTVAAARVNDMVVTGVAYVALSLVVARLVGAPKIRDSLASVPGALGHWAAWVGAIGALVCVLVVAFADNALWGNVVLPSYSLPQRPATLLAGWSWLSPASLVAINGFVVPIAEEWLWRGVVQPRLVRSLGATVGIVLTAALFSLKHAIVDASPGRLLAILAGGVVLGLVAQRATWKASAVSHIVMNTAATILVLVRSVVPSCMPTEPELSYELESARARALGLIDTRDPGEIESLFTPGFKKAIPPDKTLDFYTRVHQANGSCSWKCTTKTEGTSVVRGALSCKTGSAYMAIGIEPEPPYRVNFLVITPYPTEMLR